jgi:polyisoprenoid-binding protein YceI
MGSWQFDPHHTKVEFSGKHLGLVTVRGQFTEVTTIGNIDPIHPERSSVEATIQAASIRTHNQARDKDIRSPRFLEVDKFPVMTFKSTSVEPSGEDRYTLTGDLTIKGNTRLVTLQVMKHGESDEPTTGHRIAYSAHAQINRRDFGISFNLILDGKFVVSDEINIVIQGELIEQQEAVEALPD